MSNSSFFKTLGALPFPLTISHYHLFNSAVSKEQFREHKLDSTESWDLLRSSEPLFSIPDTREEWVAVSEHAIRKDGQDARLQERAHDIVALLKEKNINSVFSIGAGGAGLEYLIMKAFPELHLVCSDYAPKTVEILKKVFTEAVSVERFDAREDDWLRVVHSTAGPTLCLMYRVDAQLTDREWRDIFAKMAAEGVVYVLYIPTGFLTLRSLLSRLRSRLRWALAGKQSVFSGYLRTKYTFLSFWQAHYATEELTLGGMSAFWLSTPHASNGSISS